MAHDAAAALTLHPLGRHVVLLAWTGAASPGVRRLQLRIGGSSARPPFTQMAVPLEGKAYRNILALRLDRQARAAAIEIACSDGAVLAQAAGRSSAAASWEFEAHALVDGVAGADRARLIRFVLEVCGPLFRMSTDAVFVANARALLAEASAGAGPLLARCALTADHVFCEGLVPDAIGEQLSAVLLAADGVHSVAARPGLLPPASPRTGSHGLGLVLPRSAGAASVRVIVFGENGLVCRTLGPVRRRLPGVHDWLTGNGRNTASQRRYILDCLAQHRLGAAVSSTLLRELSVLAPIEARPQTQMAAPNGAPELVVDCADGLFIAGRLSDPHRLAETLWIEQGGVEQAVSLRTAARFPSAAASTVEPGARGGDREGFALFVPRRSGGGTGAPVQLALGLRSGARLDFGHGPTPLAAAEASDAVLALLLREDASESLLACVEQVSAALLRECGTARQSLHIQDFGVVPSHPAVTLIVPYESDPAMLRCRMGLFATDPLLQGVELLHVAAGLEQALAAERVLAELEAGYGVPTRLIASEQPAPAGALLNLAAAASGGTVLCFLGASAVPEATGWLRRLFDVLKARPQRGIVGAQVLYPDHSLVSAGAGIGVDARGRWSLRPLLAGFPRDYVPAAVPTRVTAVEPDCMLLPRALLQEAGGFGETYHLAASALADLSLHARSRGYEVWRLPEPAVFRMDGPRDAESAARTAARQELDRRTLERRWRDTFDETRGLPVRPATPTPPVPADAPAAAPAAGAPKTHSAPLTTQKAA